MLNGFLQGGTLPHEILGPLGILPEVIAVDLAFQSLPFRILGIDIKDTPEGS